MSDRIEPRDGVLSQADLEAFERRGFLGPYPCTTPRLARLRLPRGGRDLSNLHLIDGTVLDVCSDPAIVDRVAALLGAGGVALFKTRFWIKAPGSDRVAPWHQDVGLRNGGYDGAGRPVPTLTVWLALDGSGPAQGGLRVVPGSHRRLVGRWWQNIQADLEGAGLEDVDLGAAVDFAGPPGSFFLFHSWLLHASGVNRSELRRACLNMRFAAATAPREPGLRYLTLRPPALDAPTVPPRLAVGPGSASARGSASTQEPVLDPGR